MKIIFIAHCIFNQNEPFLVVVLYFNHYWPILSFLLSCISISFPGDRYLISITNVSVKFIKPYFSEVVMIPFLVHLSLDSHVILVFYFHGKYKVLWNILNFHIHTKKDIQVFCLPLPSGSILFWGGLYVLCRNERVKCKSTPKK